MSSAEEIANQIQRRLVQLGVNVPASAISKCASYLALLRRWNARINLTSLPLESPVSDDTIDKLIVEPLVASSLLPAGGTGLWLDLGSGGGSPALPLRTVHPDGRLTLVESRGRKCAFLREAIRSLDLQSTTVVCERFEAVTPPESSVLITLRAIRVDSELVGLLERFVSPRGHLLIFGGRVTSRAFVSVAERQLPDGSAAVLYERGGLEREDVPRGTKVS